MNTKRIFSVLFSVLAGIVMLGQAGFASANAQANAPLTSPLTYFISGTVVYKYIRWFTPAPNVTVEAKPVGNNNRYRATTNEKGLYSLQVPEGTYDVKAYDRFYTVFTPFSRHVEVYGNVSGINFMGVRN